MFLYGFSPLTTFTHPKIETRQERSETQQTNIWQKHQFLFVDSARITHRPQMTNNVCTITRPRVLFHDFVGLCAVKLSRYLLLPCSSDSKSGAEQ